MVTVARICGAATAHHSRPCRSAGAALCAVLKSVAAIRAPSGHVAREIQSSEPTNERRQLSANGGLLREYIKWPLPVNHDGGRDGEKSDHLRAPALIFGRAIRRARHSAALLLRARRPPQCGGAHAARCPA